MQLNFNKTIPMLSSQHVVRNFIDLGASTEAFGHLRQHRWLQRQPHKGQSCKLDKRFDCCCLSLMHPVHPFALYQHTCYSRTCKNLGRQQSR